MKASFFDRNFASLDRKNGHLASRLNSQVRSPRKKRLQCRLSPKADGHFTATVLSGGKSFSLISKRDPVTAAEKMAACHYRSGADTFILLGLGLGYAPMKFLERLEPHQRLIVIEPDWQLFVSQLKAVSFTSLFEDEHFSLFVDENPVHLESELRIIFWQQEAKEMVFVPQPGYESVFGKFTAGIKRFVSEEQKIIKQEQERFNAGIRSIRESCFVNGQMQNAASFFNRIKANASRRSLNDVEETFLLYKELLLSKTYQEEVVLYET